jgi:hypothetical protein
MDKKNSNPGIPTNFQIAAKDLNSCELRWEASIDDITPSSSLTYNISIRNTNTEAHVIHPLSDNLSGKRMVNQQGNVMLNKNWVINGFAPGTYSIKVQAIDGGFRGSPWAEKNFYVGSLSAPGDLTANYANEKIHLSWKDNSVNEEFFIIERKFGDGEFVKYDSVSLNVNTFLDAVNDFGNYSYRIYAVNPTQKTDYSNTAGILITELESGVENTISLYPNPAMNTMTLRVKEPKDKSAFFSIRSSTGIMIESGNFILEEQGEVHFDISTLPSGIYIVELKTERQPSSIMKLVKK